MGSNATTSRLVEDRQGLDVDEFRPVHNLDALADLVASLAADRPSQIDPRRWLGRKSGIASERAA